MASWAKHGNCAGTLRCALVMTRSCYNMFEIVGVDIIVNSVWATHSSRAAGNEI